MRQMDVIRIENLQVFANHGVFPEETALGQKFLVSAALYGDWRSAGQNDDLTQTVNYGEAAQVITAYMQAHTWKLVEAAAEHLAEELLRRFPAVQALDLEIQKPWAPVGLPLDSVSVAIHRSWHTAYIAMGSNLGDKKAWLDLAVQRMGELPGCRVEQVSDYIITAPYGGVPQDDFLNGCARIRTLAAPEELLCQLHGIENEAGRTREVHWGPRTLDLDILLYDDLIYESPTLCIPHMELEKRDFVLTPLAQIAPYVRHPRSGKTAAELWEALQASRKR